MLARPKTLNYCLSTMDRTLRGWVSSPYWPNLMITDPSDRYSAWPFTRGPNEGWSMELPVRPTLKEEAPRQDYIPSLYWKNSSPLFKKPIIYILSGKNPLLAFPLAD